MSQEKPSRRIAGKGEAMKHGFLHAAAAATLLSVTVPGLAQSAFITDEDVIARCRNELRIRDQDFIATQRQLIANGIKWRDIYAQGQTGNQRLNARVAADNQKTIDDSQASIDDLNAQGYRSTYGWLHFGGQSAVDFINNTPVGLLRKIVADYRKEVKQGNTDGDLMIQLCARETRLEKLDGKSGAQASTASQKGKK
jgi:hypothetical protein